MVIGAYDGTNMSEVTSEGCSSSHSTLDGGKEAEMLLKPPAGEPLN